MMERKRALTNRGKKVHSCASSSSASSKKIDIYGSFCWANTLRSGLDEASLSVSSLGLLGVLPPKRNRVEIKLYGNCSFTCETFILRSFFVVVVIWFSTNQGNRHFRRIEMKFISNARVSHMSFAWCVDLVLGE